MKTLYRIFLTVFLFSFLQAGPPDEFPFPGDGFAAGWQKKGRVRDFNRNGLYGHINGGSELFLEFGFKTLRLQRYADGPDEISIEMYQMESAEAALAIYLVKCGDEAPVPGNHLKPGEGVRNTGDHQQVMLLKGNFYITINNFSGKRSMLPVMAAMAHRVLEKIPAAKPGGLLSLLPRENRVDHSELLIRGLYSLQSVYTLGEGDVLLLMNKIFGVTAQYKDGEKGTYNRIIVQYPDEAYAQKAYSHLSSNLDSYITVLKNEKNELTFKDYRGKFGRVFLKKEVLHIFFNMETPVPAYPRTCVQANVL
ncbi:MAG: hypothetical protein GY950_04495 [bacterium]|nr:hypothetical protein [bacterium]